MDDRESAQSKTRCFVTGMNTGKPQMRRVIAGTVRKGQQPPGRNDPCHCGSGKKFKKCCGAPKLPYAPPRRKAPQIVGATVNDVSAADDVTSNQEEARQG
jgi:hypothetical protein